jgi:signal transduction histidine kinase
MLRAADAGAWPLAYAGDMSAMRDTFLRARIAGKIPAADLVVAAALTVLVPPVSFLAQSHQMLPAGTRHLDAIAVVLMVAACAVLVLRRLYAVPVLAAVFGLVLVYFSLGYPNGPVWLTLVVAFFGAVVEGYRLAAVAVGVIGFGSIPWLGYLIRHQKPSAVGMLGGAAWIIVLAGAGEVVRIRRERAAEAIRVREEEARLRASEERLRIARELHDSLGHYLSLISVQSAVALSLNTGLPEQAHEALVAVKEASREGLRELRSALAVLRTDGEPVPRAPTLTLARLNELVARTASAGLRVRSQTQGQARELPFGVDVAAYRIVQEALTNVAKHAGPATADVTVTYRQDDVTIQVDDDGKLAASLAPGGPVPGSTRGSGLAGMRERVTALGGELHAGPRPGGGFRVRARLPAAGAALFEESAGLTGAGAS